MINPVQYHYDAFPPKDIEWEKLIPHIGPANAALARYDGTLSAIPNANVLLSPLTTQEAVLSSKIEGTQATMGEVLEFEAQGDDATTEPRKREDIGEIINYRSALRHATKALETLPLCQRVIREAHEVLMEGVRGHGKSPGEYRKIPNWIGPPGCKIEEARYVPISAEHLREGMNRWEDYIHTEAPDRLVQLSLVHAEFEALHPFLDGNGRLGRMCVPLFMHNVELIQEPIFYISAYFEANREEYYRRLYDISADGRWTEWVVFFLKAVEEQAKENQDKAIKILNLYEQKKTEIQEITRSQYSIFALDAIFCKPVFRSSDFTSQDASIPSPTARRILKELRDKNILITLRKSKGRKSAILAFAELLEITEGEDLF